MTRRLSLRREPIGDLTTVELSAVHGAAAATGVRQCVFLEPTAHPALCLTRGHTCINCDAPRP